MEAFFAEAARRACPAFIRNGAAKAVAYFLHQSEDKVRALRYPHLLEILKMVSLELSSFGFRVNRENREFGRR